MISRFLFRRKRRFLFAGCMLWLMASMCCVSLITKGQVTCTWTGGTSKTWNLSSNWAGNVVPDSTNAVIIPAGTLFAPNLNNTNIKITDLTLGDQNLTEGTGILTITGNLANNGRITGVGKVVLGGSATQYLTGNGTITNLELNNSFGAIVGNGVGDTLKVLRLLTLTSGTLTTNNKYLMNSNGSQPTSTIGPIPASGAALSGDVIHHRYLSAPVNVSGGRSWRLLTSPLANNSVNNSIFYHWQNNGVINGTGLELFGPSGTGAGGNGLAHGGGSASIRSYDYVTNTYVPVTDTKATLLFTGTSNNTFLVFASGSYGSGNIVSGSGTTDVHATGNLITGTQNYTFTPPNATNIYYLMGNPYTCPIDFDKVYSNGGTIHINRKFWVIDPNLSSVGAYVTVTYTGSAYVASVSSSQNQYIQIGQGFFVEGSSAGIASTIAIEENDKETAAPQTAMFRTNGGSLETFRVMLYKNTGTVATLLDGAVVASHQASNNAIDGVDGLKFGNFNENIGILTSGKVLAIDARQLLDNNDTVHISLSSMQQTTYQLEIEPGNMSASGLYATLVDNYTNTITPVSLLANTTYTFNVTSNPASTGTERFTVVFNTITPLALKFINTSASKHDNKVDVQWTVASQDGTHTYEVERSGDAKSFSKIASLTATADNTYSYADEAPLNGNNYYRIKAIARSSNNGLYSNIVRVSGNIAGAELTVYPNPVKDGRLQVSVSNLTQGSYTISLYNTNGQKAATKHVNYEGGSIMIEMDIASMANGMYMMQLTNEHGETIAEQKIVKQ